MSFSGASRSGQVIGYQFNLSNRKMGANKQVFMEIHDTEIEFDDAIAANFRIVNEFAAAVFHKQFLL